MTPQENSELLKLLDTFDAAGLGNGDLNTGINLLATMSCAIANLAPVDSSIFTAEGKPVRPGTSLLVCGSASAGLVIDWVITEIARRQENLSRHLVKYLAYMRETSQRFGARQPPNGPGPNRAEEALIETQNTMDPLAGTREESWAHVLEEPPSEQVQDLADRPRFFVSAFRAGALSGQLKQLRPGQPLVHLGIERPDDFARLSVPVTALLEGRHLQENSCETVRANVIITDPLRRIKVAAAAADEHTAWLGMTVWLCDGDDGPDVRVPQESKPRRTEMPTVAAFEKAISEVIARRLNMPAPRPIILPEGTEKLSRRWSAFLRKLEPRLPGIAFGARNLLNALLFGLQQMSPEGNPRFTPEGVEALARHLVHRMANARAALMHAGELERSRGQIERIFRKLSNGPADSRTIYRSLNLTAASCGEALRWLEESGLLSRAKDKFMLAPGAKLDFKNNTAPLIEV